MCHSNNMRTRRGQNPPGKAPSLSRRSSQQGRPAAQPSAHLEAKPLTTQPPNHRPSPPTLTGRQSDCAEAPVLLVPVPAGQLCTAREGRQAGEQCTQERSIDLVFCGHCPGIHPARGPGTEQGRSHSCPTPGSWLNHRCQQSCPVGTTGRKLSRMCCGMSQGCR